MQTISSVLFDIFENMGNHSPIYEARNTCQTHINIIPKDILIPEYLLPHDMHLGLFFSLYFILHTYIHVHIHLLLIQIYLEKHILCIDILVFWVYLVIDKKAIVQPTASRSSIWLCWSKCANLPRNTINRSTHSRFAFLWDFDYGFAFHLIAREKKGIRLLQMHVRQIPYKNPIQR